MAAKRTICLLLALCLCLTLTGPALAGDSAALSEELLAQWINPGEHIDAQSALVNETAAEICAGLSGELEKARAISEWVTENIAYDDYTSQGREFSSVDLMPDEVLGSRLTVCEGYARLTQALLRAAGIPCLHIIGHSSGSPDVWHAWNLAFVEGRWLWLDNTWGMGWFDMDTRHFAETHILDGGVKLRPLESNYTVPVRELTAAEDIPSEAAQPELWSAICAGLLPYDLQRGYRSTPSREDFCRLMLALVERVSGKGAAEYLEGLGLSAEPVFSDCGRPEVLAACALGITRGCGGGLFLPEAEISREQALTMLSRTAKLLGLEAPDGLPGEPASGLSLEEAVLAVYRLYAEEA